MQNLRNNPPAELASSKVVSVIDYQAGIRKNLDSNTELALELPNSNVLQFISKDGTKISARPSGTEPKIKFYIEVKENLENNNDFDKQSARLDQKIAQIKKDLDF